MTSPRLLGLAVLASASVVGACTSFGPTRLDRVDGNERVILSSGRPFPLHTEVAGVRAECISHEVSGRVVRRSTDTLYLLVSARRSVSTDEPAFCAPPLSGFVTYTQAMDIKGRQFAVLPTAVLLAVLAPVVMILWFVAAGWTYSL